ncbi:MAG: tryptophan--tRNA ligase [Candidatus Harrisonbacteria bacterium RIFCSPLOWO2_02_FULL_41_11]|uniref:Tryptophan--tRNA ligase n=1 Tax=Candidatus Harrisonbacteria bacterium RIFCSPHIGHO2_02_FULL_42_16 TaxID=1798404 RepID=A0A1G1ZGY6_9BACT|nr:MAG: tryptophan--tRNA ligase [Candidatus Harrisonbacteria bacterium RIFCSPHIGHO2_02_FULL_42_16]OGY67005.1 MAG: tryptophan--tRNA ligase [Candidatus Harrisonbacteria bacterium RIFCSPLOWO2_02_FULL_41_11]
MKPILISGIQPTGRLHLGNYLGALKNFVELQNSGKYQCYFFIADYHSLTIDFSPKQKEKEILAVAQSYLAAGIDPKKSVIFVQSQAPESTELTWILSTITPPGELNRMTQFKDKAQNDPNNINMGLVTYPLLMAADILLYDAKFVPVGDDQLQHLELARTLARKFNNKFGKTFIEPQAILAKTARVMSLDNPQKKMSKTLPSGCLFLDDSEKEIMQKIKSAVTDSGSEIKYDEKNKPGLSNLLSIYSELSERPVMELEKKYYGKGYGEFKTDLAKVVVNSLKSFHILNHQPSILNAILNSGFKKAKKQVVAKMKEIKSKLGLPQVSG